MIDIDIQLVRQGFELNVTARSEAHVLGVFGASGAGKTTLINLIAGLVKPDRGSITINGTTLFDSKRGINLPAHQRRIGVVFQEHRLFPHYSVSGNLHYGAKGDRSKLDAMAELLGITPLLGRRVNELSGGERQRVALGRALLCQPNALLLDEPLASLDHHLRHQILPYLKRVQDSVSIPIVYVSHELSEILQLTDQLLVLENGGAAALGAFSELVHQDAAQNVLHDRGLTNVIAARVVDQRQDEGVATLAIEASKDSSQPSATFLAPPTSAARGAAVTILIQPWDIAVSLGPVSGVSIQNQITGVISRISVHDRRVLVEVDIGTPIIVEVSRRSVNAMQLNIGKAVTCLIKSHAIRYSHEHGTVLDRVVRSTT